MLKAYRACVEKGLLRPDDHQLQLALKLSSLQDSLIQSRTSSEPNIKGLYIHGPVGTGKSRLMDMFAETTKQMSHRAHFHHFMQSIHTRLFVERQKKDFKGDPLLDIGREMAGITRVLCFDEFQVTDVADAALLKRLFEGIFDAGGVLIATSNRHPSRLYENGINRKIIFSPFLRLLLDRCEVFSFPDSRIDYRLTKKASKTRPTLYNHASQSAMFNRAFAEDSGIEYHETESPDLHPFQIRVSSDRILVVYTASTDHSCNTRFTARASFKDLCERSRGVQDYMSLFTFTSRVYITDVRKLLPHELDVARRFITLIDCAYEAKTKLSLLSSCPLAELFLDIIYFGETAKTAANTQLSVVGSGGSSSSFATTM
jgi:protein AFG1